MATELSNQNARLSPTSHPPRTFYIAQTQARHPPQGAAHPRPAAKELAQRHGTAIRRAVTISSTETSEPDQTDYVICPRNHNEHIDNGLFRMIRMLSTYFFARDQYPWENIKDLMRVRDDVLHDFTGGTGCTTCALLRHEKREVLEQGLKMQARHARAGNGHINILGAVHRQCLLFSVEEMLEDLEKEDPRFFRRYKDSRMTIEEWKHIVAATHEANNVILKIESWSEAWGRLLSG